MSSWFSWLAGKPAKSPELREAEGCFTDAELKELQRHFQEAYSYNAGGHPAPRDATPRGLGGPRFGALLGPVWPCLEPLLQSQLLRLVCDRTDGRVHLEGLIIAKARLERMGEEASLAFTFHLLNLDSDPGPDPYHGRGGITAASLEAAVVSCLRLAGALDPPQAAAVSMMGAATAAKPAATAAAAAAVSPAGAGAAAAAPPSGPVGSSHSAVVVETREPAASGAASGLPADVRQHIAAVCRGALAFAAEDDGGSRVAVADWASVRMSYEKYRQWTKRCPALHKTLCGVLRHVGSSGSGVGGGSGGGGGGVIGSSGAAVAAAGGGRAGDGARGGGATSGVAAGGSLAGQQQQQKLPALVQLGKLPASATLLQPVWAWALSSRLPPAQRAEWRLLFSSQRDGKSFNTFFGRVSAAAGPTLLLLRDRAGALCGGFASQPWARSGSYYGDVSCFVFSLLPTLQIFPATGINDNYQWCGVGFSQLPGGLGFGGAAAARGHFSLYVEPSLDAGMSRPIATYGNTPLASEQLFQIDTLECWLLQPPEDEEEQEALRTRGEASGSGHSRRGSGGKGSGRGGGVLSKNAEDRAIMQLAGMQFNSEGLRDEPLEED